VSSDLKITFAPDMPAASVEVLSPDLQVVARVMLAAGKSRTVNVPSEASFLRVRMPSGQNVILKDPGNLSRVISMQSIEKTTARVRSALTPAVLAPEEIAFEEYLSELSVSDIEFDQSHSVMMERAPRARPIRRLLQDLPLSSFATSCLRSGSGEKALGTATGEREARWKIEGNPRQSPMLLEIKRPIGWLLQVKLPGDVQRCRVRADAKRKRDVLTLSAQISTGEPVADTIMNYLQRGDFYSAETMTDWVEEAEEMLLDKRQDAYATAVGGYLLLRMKKFQRLHRWAKNLADWFPFLPDGCVIWAWQMILESQSDAGEIKKYLLEASRRGLPVYTEGLRLLMDGLRLVGPDARPAYKELVKQAGVVLWDSPLSASIFTKEDYSPGQDSQQVVCNIGFAADV